MKLPLDSPQPNNVQLKKEKKGSLKEWESLQQYKYAVQLSGVTLNRVTRGTIRTRSKREEKRKRKKKRKTNNFNVSRRRRPVQQSIIDGRLSGKKLLEFQIDMLETVHSLVLFFHLIFRLFSFLYVPLTRLFCFPHRTSSTRSHLYLFIFDVNIYVSILI